MQVMSFTWNIKRYKDESESFAVKGKEFRSSISIAFYLDLTPPLIQRLSSKVCVKLQLPSNFAPAVRCHGKVKVAFNKSSGSHFGCGMWIGQQKL